VLEMVTPIVYVADASTMTVAVVVSDHELFLSSELSRPYDGLSLC
jgi:hypothetical protein